MRLQKSVKTKLFHLFSIAAAIVVLVLLNHFVVNREPPLVRIGEISPRMNFSTVRVEGLVESAPRILRDGRIFFAVNDGSGTLPVFTSQPLGGRMPRSGSRVSVTGNLNIGAGNNVRLRTKIGQHPIVLAEPAGRVFISDSNLADISVEQEGERITVCGRVSRVWHPREGSRAPHKIVLEDQSGTLDVVHWLEESPSVEVGDEVEATGRIDLYEGRLQLRLWEAADLRPYVRHPVPDDGPP